MIKEQMFALTEVNMNYARPREQHDFTGSIRGCLSDMQEHAERIVGTIDKFGKEDGVW